MTAREQTTRQIARCEALDQRLEQQRQALRRECSMQRAALRRCGTRIDLAAEQSRHRRPRQESNLRHRA